MPIKTDIHNPEANAQRDSVPPHTLSPIPHRSGSGLFGSTLPSLQENRCVFLLPQQAKKLSLPCSHIYRYNTSSYDHTPSPASTTSLYSQYSYQQPGYPTSTSPYSPSVPSLVSSYSMPSEPSRSRIPSMYVPFTNVLYPGLPLTNNLGTAQFHITIILLHRYDQPIPLLPLISRVIITGALRMFMYLIHHSQLVGA